MSFYEDLPRELAKYWPSDKMLIPPQVRTTISAAWNKMPQSWRDELVEKIESQPDKLEQVKTAAVESVYALLDKV